MKRGAETTAREQKAELRKDLSDHMGCVRLSAYSRGSSGTPAPEHQDRMDSVFHNGASGSKLQGHAQPSKQTVGCLGTLSRATFHSIVLRKQSFLLLQSLGMLSPLPP